MDFILYSRNIIAKHNIKNSIENSLLIKQKKSMKKMDQKGDLVNQSLFRKIILKLNIVRFFCFILYRIQPIKTPKNVKMLYNKI